MHRNRRLTFHRSAVPGIVLLLVFLGLSATTSAQNYYGTVSELPVVTKTINTALSLDSLQTFLKQLTGELQVIVDGMPVSIPHRFAGGGSQEYRDAARHIANTFDRYGLQPVLENNAMPYTTLNVIGTLPGRRAEYVVICGHFDSKSEECPGADDNASGTSAVLEAARLLHSIAFEYTIKFIAFGGEELGMLGSGAYVMVHGGDSIRAVVNLDMIAWDGDANRVVQIHSTNPTATNRSDELAVLITDVDEVYSLPNEVRLHSPGIDVSDHAPFWARGHSAVLLIEEYGSDFNPSYHSPQDTWSSMSGAAHQALFKNITQLAVASVMHLAQPLDPLLDIAAAPADGALTRIAVYPNPARGRTTILWQASIAEDVNIVISDLLGRVVHHSDHRSDRAGLNTSAADLTGLPAGVYIVRLEAGRVHSATKLIVR